MVSTLGLSHLRVQLTTKDRTATQHAANIVYIKVAAVFVFHEIVVSTINGNLGSVNSLCELPDVHSLR